MRYSTVLFDLDHTLLDSDASELAAFDHTMALAGVGDGRAHLATYLTLNKALWARVERGELSPDEVRVQRFTEFVGVTGVDADPAAMAEWFVDGLADNGELYDGARAVLEALAGRCRMALVTNGLSTVQRRRVERLGIAPYFEAVVISAEVGCSKPSPAIFELCFGQLGGIERERAVMIGDSLSADVAGGLAAGIDTCWYNRHGVDHDHDATYEVRSLYDVTEVLVG